MITHVNADLSRTKPVSLRHTYAWHIKLWSRVLTLFQKHSYVSVWGLLQLIRLLIILSAAIRVAAIEISARRWPAFCSVCICKSMLLLRIHCSYVYRWWWIKAGRGRRPTADAQCCNRRRQHLNRLQPPPLPWQRTDVTCSHACMETGLWRGLQVAG